MRIKAASPQEWEQLLEQLIQIGDGLPELDSLPTQSELAAWTGAGNCPPETLAEVAERLAVLWSLGPGQVHVPACSTSTILAGPGCVNSGGNPSTA